MHIFTITLTGVAYSNILQAPFLWDWWMIGVLAALIKSFSWFWLSYLNTPHLPPPYNRILRINTLSYCQGSFSRNVPVPYLSKIWMWLMHLDTRWPLCILIRKKWSLCCCWTVINSYFLCMNIVWCTCRFKIWNGDFSSWGLGLHKDFSNFWVATKLTI